MYKMEQAIPSLYLRRIKHLLAQPDRIARVRRYLKYKKAQRLLALAEREMAEGKTCIQARPVYMNLDTGPLCNLHCPFCWTGNGQGRLKRELLKPETFRKIAARLPLDSLYEVGLFNWGEPFLNPNLFDYIRFFASRGIHVVIHTNFSVADHDAAFMEQLIHTGIGEVVASVDGASSDSYGAYRVGGDFQRVTRNLGLLAATRSRLDREFPKIVFKMILHRFNQHEVDQAQALAASLGAEFLLQEQMGMPDSAREAWTSSRMQEKHGYEATTHFDRGTGAAVITECRQMWDSLVVGADGSVFPCCLVAEPESAIGNLTEQPFDTIWNGEKMQALRRYALDLNSPALEFPNSCAGCLFRNCRYKNREKASQAPSC